MSIEQVTIVTEEEFSQSFFKFLNNMNQMEKDALLVKLIEYGIIKDPIKIQTALDILQIP